MATGSVIQEYLIGLGFKLDDPASKRFNETLDKTAKGFLHVGETAIATASAVGLAVEKIASNYEDLYYLSQRTGATIQSLQATAYGFTQIGLSAGDAKSMVDGLAMTLRTQPGTGGLLSALGVGAGDANKQAHDLVKQLSHMPFYVASQYAGIFGISPMQLTQMELGLGDLDRAEADHIRRQNEAGIATEDLGSKSHTFLTELRKMEDEFGLLETKIGQDFIGPATAAVDEVTRMTEWFLKADTATSGWLTTIGSLVASFVALRVAGAALAGIAGVFGAGAETKAAISTATGGGIAGFLGRITRGGAIPVAIGALGVMKSDSKHGNMLRSELRGLFGLPDDPNEPAPWAAGGSWGNKAATTDDPNATLKDILGVLHDIADKDQPFGGLADVHFGGAANPYNNRGGITGPAPGPSPADSAALINEGQARAGWWTPQRQQHAIETLVAGGVSPLGAAALVSRWKNVESGAGPASVNPTSGAFGIGQWLGTRKPGIAGDTDFDHQLAYTLKELHSSESRALNLLNAAKTPWEAARGATAYERAHNFGKLADPETDDFTKTTWAGIAGVQRDVAAPVLDHVQVPTAWWGAMEPFPSASAANAIPTGNLSDYFGAKTPTPALGSDGSGRGGGDVTITASPIINVSGGADPKLTADHVLKQQSSVNADIVRNAGATVR